MTPCEINDVDIVAHCGAVAGIPIAPEDLQGRCFAFEDLCRDWEQVRRLLPGVFA